MRSEPELRASPLSASAALLVIDVQKGLDDPKYGERNNPDAERNMASLLALWRDRGRPIVHVQHMSVEPGSPLRPELPGNGIKPDVAPRSGEPVFRKTRSSAFTGTELESHLRSLGIEQLVLVGLTTDHCVSSTARSAADLGFRTLVVSDATATHERRGADGNHHGAEEMHRAALASLQGEFASIHRTEELLSRFDARG